MLPLPRSTTVILDDVSERIAVLFALYDSSASSDDHVLDYIIHTVQHFHHVAAAAISANRLSEAFAVLRKCEDIFTEKSSERKVLAARCAVDTADQDVVDALKQRTYVLLSRLEAKRNREDASLQPHPVYYKKHLPPVPGSRVAESVAAATEGRNYRRPDSTTAKGPDRHVAIDPEAHSSGPIPSLVSEKEEEAEAEQVDEHVEAVMVCPMPPPRTMRPLHPLDADATTASLPVGGPRKDRADAQADSPSKQEVDGDAQSWRVRSEDHLQRAAKAIRSAQNCVNSLLTEPEQQQARVQVRKVGRSRLREQLEEEMKRAVGAEMLMAHAAGKIRNASSCDASPADDVDAPAPPAAAPAAGGGGGLALAFHMAASAATAIAPVRPTTNPTTKATSAAKSSRHRTPTGALAAGDADRARSPASAATLMGASGSKLAPEKYAVLFEEPQNPLFQLFAAERLKEHEGSHGVASGTNNPSTPSSSNGDPLLNFSDQKQLVMKRLQMLNMIPTEHVLSTTLHEEMKKKVEGGVRYKPAVPLDRAEMERYVPPSTVDRIMGPRDLSASGHASAQDAPVWSGIGMVVEVLAFENPVVPSLQHLQRKKPDWTVLSEDYMGTCLELCVACRRIQFATRMFLAKVALARRSAAAKASYESNHIKIDAVFIVMRALRAKAARRRVRDMQQHVQHLIDQRVELELKGGMLGGFGGKDKSRSRVGTLFASSGRALSGFGGGDSMSDIGSLFDSTVLLGHSINTLRTPRRRASSMCSEGFAKQVLYAIPHYIPRRFCETLRAIQQKMAARKIRRFYVERNAEIVSNLFIEALGYADHLSGATAFPYCPSDFTNAPRHSSTGFSDRSSLMQTNNSEPASREGEGLVFTFQSAQSIMSKYSGDDVANTLLASIDSAQGPFAPLVPVKLSELAAAKSQAQQALETLRNLEEERLRKAQEAALLRTERRRAASVLLQRTGRGYATRRWLQNVYLQARQSRSHRLKMWASTSSRSVSLTHAEVTDAHPAGHPGLEVLVSHEHTCVTPGAEWEIMRLIKLRSSHLLPEFREQKQRERLQATVLVQALLRACFSAEYVEWRLVQRAARTIQARWRQHMAHTQRVSEAKASIRAVLMQSGAWGVDVSYPSHAAAAGEANRRASGSDSWQCGSMWGSSLCASPPSAFSVSHFLPVSPPYL